MADDKTYCLCCDKLLKGRSDKRYCNDDCRNAYFNEQKKTEHTEIRAIDLALKKNRRILKESLGDARIRSVKEKLLLMKGFDFRYHTHTFTSLSGGSYKFCYEYGYQLKKDNKLMIVKELPIVKGHE